MRKNKRNNRYKKNKIQGISPVLIPSVNQSQSKILIEQFEHAINDSLVNNRIPLLKDINVLVASHAGSDSEPCGKMSYFIKQWIGVVKLYEHTCSHNRYLNIAIATVIVMNSLFFVGKNKEDDFVINFRVNGVMSLACILVFKIYFMNFKEHSLDLSADLYGGYLHARGHAPPCVDRLVMMRMLSVYQLILLSDTMINDHCVIKKNLFNYNYLFRSSVLERSLPSFEGEINDPIFNPDLMRGLIIKVWMIDFFRRPYNCLVFFSSFALSFILKGSLSSLLEVMPALMLWDFLVVSKFFKIPELVFFNFISERFGFNIKNFDKRLPVSFLNKNDLMCINKLKRTDVRADREGNVFVFLYLGLLISNILGAADYTQGFCVGNVGVIDMATMSYWFHCFNFSISHWVPACNEPQAMYLTSTLSSSAGCKERVVSNARSHVNNSSLLSAKDRNIVSGSLKKRTKNKRIKKKSPLGYNEASISSKPKEMTGETPCFEVYGLSFLFDSRQQGVVVTPFVDDHKLQKKQLKKYHKSLLAFKKDSLLQFYNLVDSVHHGYGGHSDSTWSLLLFASFESFLKFDFPCSSLMDKIHGFESLHDSIRDSDYVNTELMQLLLSQIYLCLNALKEMHACMLVIQDLVLEFQFQSSNLTIQEKAHAFSLGFSFLLRDRSVTCDQVLSLRRSFVALSHVLSCDQMALLFFDLPGRLSEFYIQVFLSGTAFSLDSLDTSLSIDPLSTVILKDIKGLGFRCEMSDYVRSLSYDYLFDSIDCVELPGESVFSEAVRSLMVDLLFSIQHLSGVKVFCQGSCVTKLLGFDGMSSSDIEDIDLLIVSDPGVNELLVASIALFSKRVAKVTSSLFSDYQNFKIPVDDCHVIDVTIMRKLDSLLMCDTVRPRLFLSDSMLRFILDEPIASARMKFLSLRFVDKSFFNPMLKNHSVHVIKSCAQLSFRLFSMRLKNRIPEQSSHQTVYIDTLMQPASLYPSYLLLSKMKFFLSVVAESSPYLFDKVRNPMLNDFLSQLIPGLWFEPCSPSVWISPT